MGFHTAVIPSPTNPMFTTRSFCVCGPSRRMFLLEVLGIVGGTVAGAFIGGLLGPSVSAAFDIVGEWIIGLFPGVTWWKDFLDWMKEMFPIPPRFKGMLVGGALGLATSVAFFEAGDCPACPPGRRCFCFCMTFWWWILVSPPYPCGSTCGVTAPGCT